MPQKGVSQTYTGGPLESTSYDLNWKIICRRSRPKREGSKGVGWSKPKLLITQGIGGINNVFNVNWIFSVTPLESIGYKRYPG